jgi:hypothetical protein
MCVKPNVEQVDGSFKTSAQDVYAIGDVWRSTQSGACGPFLEIGHPSCSGDSLSTFAILFQFLPTVLI